jgi:hypothetical protein
MAGLGLLGLLAACALFAAAMGVSRRLPDVPANWRPAPLLALPDPPG